MKKTFSVIMVILLFLAVAPNLDTLSKDINIERRDLQTTRTDDNFTITKNKKPDKFLTSFLRRQGTK